MTAQEIETVAVLLKRVRERVDLAKQVVSHPITGIGYAHDLAEGMKSLAAAVEMCATELSDLRNRYEAHLRADATRNS